jgi:hypothetical protein
VQQHPHDTHVAYLQATGMGYPGITLETGVNELAAFMMVCSTRLPHFSRPVVQSGLAQFTAHRPSTLFFHFSLLSASICLLQEMESFEIRSRADECLSDFDALVVVQPSADDRRNADDLDGEEQRARFLIWSANIGVFADGHASLDYRLRDSLEARKLMLDLLRSLKNYLRRGLQRSSLI